MHLLHPWKMILRGRGYQTQRFATKNPKRRRAFTRNANLLQKKCFFCISNLNPIKFKSCFASETCIFVQSLSHYLEASSQATIRKFSWFCKTRGIDCHHPLHLQGFYYATVGSCCFSTNYTIDSFMYSSSTSSYYFFLLLQKCPAQQDWIELKENKLLFSVFPEFFII